MRVAIRSIAWLDERSYSRRGSWADFGGDELSCIVNLIGMSISFHFPGLQRHR
jgi:hypothetical protein